MRSMVEGAQLLSYHPRVRTTSRTLTTARRLRREMTPPEVYLWARLRLPTQGAPRWRRQAPFGRYVLDFYCAPARLVAEVDGWGHNMGDQPERDEQRNEWLTVQGLEVVRFAASEVLGDPNEVADILTRMAVARLAPRPSRR